MSENTTIRRRAWTRNLCMLSFAAMNGGRAVGPMSMFDLAVMASYLGWPGLMVGGVGGALIARRRKIIWGIGAALVGLALCIWLRLAMAL
jgi:hypothetical protein